MLPESAAARHHAVQFYGSDEILMQTVAGFLASGLITGQPALVVATPLFEELLFRGFVFAGIQDSALGGVGAVLITAHAWTWIHYEADPLEAAIIFIVALMLGSARLRTGSLLLPIAMHMLYSLFSAGEIAWLAAMAGAD